MLAGAGGLALAFAQIFVLGKSFDGVPANQGRLYLRIQPWPTSGGANGSYTVKLSATPR